MSDELFLGKWKRTLSAGEVRKDHSVSDEWVFQQFLCSHILAQGSGGACPHNKLQNELNFGSLWYIMMP